MRNTVVIDTASGQALIGDTLVPVREAGSHGELQVGGSHGPILRPLTFGERSRVVTRAVGSPAALDILCAGMLQVALVQPGEADRFVQEILALQLAGADQDAPPFAETVLQVARTAGWELQQVYDAEAAEVDRLAIYLGGQPPDSGWTQIVFASSVATLTSVRQELAEQLLRRAKSFAETPEEQQAFPMVTAPATPTLDASFPARTARSLVNSVLPTERSLSNPEPRTTTDTVPEAPVHHKQAVATVPRPSTLASESHATRNMLYLRVPPRIFGQRTGTASAPAVTRSGENSPPRFRFSLSATTNSRHGNSGSLATASAAQTVASEGASAPLPVQPPPLQLLRPRLAVRPTPRTMLTSAEQHLTFPPVQFAQRETPIPNSVDISTASEQKLAVMDWTEMADALAELLEQESDMRGLNR